MIPKPTDTGSLQHHPKGKLGWARSGLTRNHVLSEAGASRWGSWGNHSQKL